jgi:hypothetical protein
MGLESCPVTGCGTSPPAGTDWVTLLPNLDLATDSANVHVLGGGHVDSCTLPGCTPSSRLTAAGLGDVRYASTFAVTPRIATDGVSVYFFDYGPSAPWVPATGVRLSKCPVAGCPVTGPEVLWTSPAWPSTPAQRPLALAVDGANVFFTAMQPDLTSWLVKMPK